MSNMLAITPEEALASLAAIWKKPTSLQTRLSRIARLLLPLYNRDVKPLLSADQIEECAHELHQAFLEPMLSFLSDKDSVDEVLDAFRSLTEDDIATVVNRYIVEKDDDEGDEAQKARLTITLNGVAYRFNSVADLKDILNLSPEDITAFAAGLNALIEPFKGFPRPGLFQDLGRIRDAISSAYKAGKASPLPETEKRQIRRDHVRAFNQAVTAFTYQTLQNTTSEAVHAKGAQINTIITPALIGNIASSLAAFPEQVLQALIRRNYKSLKDQWVNAVTQTAAPIIAIACLAELLPPLTPFVETIERNCQEAIKAYGAPAP